MTLSLILSTLNQLSAPEESIVDDRSVMTPLSFRHFPSPEDFAGLTLEAKDEKLLAVDSCQIDSAAGENR